MKQVVIGLRLHLQWRHVQRQQQSRQTQWLHQKQLHKSYNCELSKDNCLYNSQKALRRQRFFVFEK